MVGQGITANTKLIAPPLRADLVRRGRISKLIRDAATAKLVVVAAPAGFGKTTSLAAIANEDNKTAWLSLDGRDQDSSRFWLNVVQALRQVEPRIGAESVDMFGSTNLEHLTQGVLSLSNDMAEMGPTPFRRLVLDDYHFIDNPTVHKTLTTLIESLPAGWQLLIATRSVPPLPIAMLRVRAQICEIGPDELRFSASEARWFFQQSGKIDLTESTLTVIRQRTEGWAAALQLLANSLDMVDDHAKFIREFAGDNRMIADYFNAEVLAGQSARTRRFLMVSALSDRICAPLAQSLMDELPDLRHEDACAMLEFVEQANLFLVPMDQRRKWYRYHQLFHDLLREQAEREFSEELPALRRKAADWFEQNLHYDDAVRLLQQMEDYPGCERVILKASQQYEPEGRFFELREWLRLLPENCIGGSPRLVLLASLIAFNSGQPREAKKWLGLLVKLASKNSAALHDDTVLALELRGFSLLAAAWVETNRNNSVAARTMTAQFGEIFDQLKDPSAGTLARLSFPYGELLFQSAKLPEARRRFRQGIAACRDRGDGVLAGGHYTRVAATYRLAGALRQMKRTAEEGLDFIGTTRAAGRLEACGYLHQFVGEWNLERYEVDLACEALREIHFRAQRTEHYLLQLIAGLSWTTALRCLGQLDDALELSKGNLELAENQDTKIWFMSGPGPTYVKTLIEAGDIDGAADWIASNRLMPDDDFDYLQEYEYLALSRVLLARRDYETAAPLLTRIRSQSEAGGRNRVALEAMILSSMLAHARNDKVAAIAQLDDALAIASRENYVRVLLDEGDGLIRQLREIDETNPNHAFVRKILGFSGPKRDRITQMNAVRVGMLSKREAQVLQLISDGCSNREVATKLYLSPHTVKAHTRNIYEKLAVSSRTQAVAKASKLGLISVSH